MFRVLLLCLGLSTVPAFSQEAPQPQQRPQIRTVMPMKCGLTADVAKGMRDENQHLIFFARGNEYITMLYRNTEKTDWYVVVSPNEHPERSCIVLDGESSDTNVPTGIPFKSERQALSN